MRRFSRDPEAIVQRLLQSERHRSAGAQDEVLALGPVAVPGISAESRLDDRFADLRHRGQDRVAQHVERVRFGERT